MLVSPYIFHRDFEAIRIPLENFLGVYCLFRGHFVYAVDVLQVWKFIHKYRCVTISLLRESSFHVRNESHLEGLQHVHGNILNGSCYFSYSDYLTTCIISFSAPWILSHCSEHAVCTLGDWRLQQLLAHQAYLRHCINDLKGKMDEAVVPP